MELPPTACKVAPVESAPVEAFVVGQVLEPSSFPVTVPAGAGPGTQLHVTAPNGVMMAVQVPEGATVGSTFHVGMPTQPQMAWGAQNMAAPQPHMMAHHMPGAQYGGNQVAPMPMMGGIAPAPLAGGVRIAGSGWLVYDLDVITCCGGGRGVDAVVVNDLPPEIQAAGVSLDQWRSWMESLRWIQNNKQPKGGFTVWLCCLVVPIFTGCFWLPLCPLSSVEMGTCLPCCWGTYHAAMHQWLADVNKTLEPKGIKARFLNYKHPEANAYRPRTPASYGRAAMTDLITLEFAFGANDIANLYSSKVHVGNPCHCPSDEGRAV